MKKTIAILCAVLLVFATLSPSIALLADAASNSGMPREERLKRSSYTFLYFYQLENNLPENVVGTCGYVALAMLLSYYDCFWDDNLVPDEYMISEISGENQSTGDDLYFYYRMYDSPGTLETLPEEIRNSIGEAWHAVDGGRKHDNSNYTDERNMLWSIYQYFLSEYSDNSMHSLLINLLSEQNTVLDKEYLESVFGAIDVDNVDTIMDSILDGSYATLLDAAHLALLANSDKQGGLGENDQEILLWEYLQHIDAENADFDISDWNVNLEDRFVSNYGGAYNPSSDPLVNESFATNADYLRYKVIEYLKSGIPVYITATYKHDRSSVEDDRAHAVVAYDYDEENDIIYVHSGWKGRGDCYFNLDDLSTEEVSIRSYMVLEHTGEHVHSNNYYFDDTPNGACSCQLPNHQHKHTYLSISPEEHRQTCWCGAYEDVAHRFKAQGLNQAICIDCGFVKIVGLDTPVVSPLDMDIPPVQTNTFTDEEKKK